MVSSDQLTPQEAKHLALHQARAQAIEKAVGVKVRAETLVREFAVANPLWEGDSCRLEAKQCRGWVLGERSLCW